VDFARRGKREALGGSPRWLRGAPGGSWGKGSSSTRGRVLETVAGLGGARQAARAGRALVGGRVPRGW